MNAKVRKEINRQDAYRILLILNDEKYWDPVTTAFLTENQCINRLVKIVGDYFKSHNTLGNWGKNSYIDEIANNSEIGPMMQHYEFNKYKENLEEVNYGKDY